MPKKERTLTPAAYLVDIKHRKDLINNVQFIPPKLGSKGFGSFRVQYDTFVLVDALWATIRTD